MSDWKLEISHRLEGLSLVPTREAAIIEELAQHLEDCYAEFVASGATESEAERRTLAASARCAFSEFCPQIGHTRDTAASVGSRKVVLETIGRGERIRTSDLSVPNRAHYQAVLRPELTSVKQTNWHSRGRLSKRSSCIVIGY